MPVRLTEVSFHFNAPDKLAYACRLLRKAVNGGSQVVVTASPETLTMLDMLLWKISPLEFIGHCFADANAAMVCASPVLLGMPAVLLQAEAGAFDLKASEGDLNKLIRAERTVLVNLGDSVPQGFERFERLVELVGANEEDRLNARDRWKHYAHRGYAIIRHDLAATSFA